MSITPVAEYLDARSRNYDTLDESSNRWRHLAHVLRQLNRRQTLATGGTTADDFDSLLPLRQGTSEATVSSRWSRTASQDQRRDAWVYNFDQPALAANVKNT